MIPPGAIMPRIGHQVASRAVTADPDHRRLARGEPRAARPAPDRPPGITAGVLVQRPVLERHADETRRHRLPVRRGRRRSADEQIGARARGAALRGRGPSDASRERRHDQRCKRRGEARAPMVRIPADTSARHPASATAMQTSERTMEALGAHRPGRDHRLLGRRQVDRDGRVRGRGLLLRRQPALGDDPLARRAVHARRLQGRPRRGRLRRARRRATSRGWRRSSTTSARSGVATACCSWRPTSRRC